MEKQHITDAERDEIKTYIMAVHTQWVIYNMRQWWRSVTLWSLLLLNLVGGGAALFIRAKAPTGSFVPFLLVLFVTNVAITMFVGERSKRMVARLSRPEILLAWREIERMDPQDNARLKFLQIIDALRDMRNDKTEGVRARGQLHLFVEVAWLYPELAKLEFIKELRFLIMKSAL